MALIHHLSDRRQERSETLRTVESAMSIRFLVMRLRGRTKATDLSAFYGFAPEDVAETHLYKVGTGAGLWFRLNDGRVFDALGRRSLRDRVAYRPMAARDGKRPIAG